MWFLHQVWKIRSFIWSKSIWCSNRPFPSSLVPLFQSESKCETILMKMTLICMKMKLHAELIFIWKVSHLDLFWNRGTRELGNGLFLAYQSCPAVGPFQRSPSRVRPLGTRMLANQNCYSRMKDVRCWDRTVQKDHGSNYDGRKWSARQRLTSLFNTRVKVQWCPVTYHARAHSLWKTILRSKVRET